MRQRTKKVVAVLVGVMMVVAPATANAGEYCSTYQQVESNSTGGDYVGGLLVYESMGSVGRSDPVVTTTVSTTTGGEAGVPGTGVNSSQTITVSTTGGGEVRTVPEPFGYYQMNDGSMYQINCVTGQEKQLRPPTKD